jgi:hypothetical protein
MRLAAVLSIVTLATSAVASPGVHVFQNQGNQRITGGETVVPGDPATIYAVVQDYARWVDVFPDVAKVIITWKKGTDARVTLVKPDGNQDNLKFHQTPQARMVYFEDTGNQHADVWGEIVCAPGDQPNTTRIHTRLYVDVHGLATLVVRDGDVKKMREQRIARDLEHVRGYFTRTSSR